MKNIIRFIGFFLALFLATSMSAQSATSPTNAKGGQTAQYLSMSDNAVIDVVQGPVSYTVFIQKTPEAAWVLIASQSNTSQGASFSFPGSFQIKVILSNPSTSVANVNFSN